MAFSPSSPLVMPPQLGDVADNGDPAKGTSQYVLIALTGVLCGTGWALESSLEELRFARLPRLKEKLEKRFKLKADEEDKTA